ncbi:MAG: hypothetical protein JWM98_2398 [Thermoleophilia bacterium]|nr:hypothetical protein [Thermoleophilia bacterium]
MVRATGLACAVACLFALGSSQAATSSTTVGATVPSATSIDTTACQSLAFPTLPVNSTSIAPNCSLTFGSSNDTARLTAWQQDQTGDAMTRHSSAWSIRKGLGYLYGAAISPDGARAWIGGNDANNAVVLHTSTDGGLTWTNQTACAGETRIYAIVAVSASVALTAGGRMCRTTDGGATWTTVTVPGSGTIRSLSIAADGTIWAASSAGSSRLLRSTDNGVTWINRPIPVADLTYGLAALSATSAVVVGRHTNGTNSESVEWHTSDGGLTWATSVLSSTTNFGYFAMAADASPGGTVLAANYSPTNGIFRSTDGGATWTALQPGFTPLNVRWMGGTTWEAAYATQGLVKRSTDDGLTWSVVPTGATSSLQVWNVMRPVGGVSLLVGASELVFRSTDGGASYTETTPTRTIYRAVAHLSRQRFVAVASAGVVTYTSDGGATLQTGASGTGAAFGDVESDHDRAIAVGTGGTVVVSDDGGATWQSRTTGTGASLADIDRAERTGELVVVGSSGALIRSTDRGDTWSPVTSPTGTSLTNVAVSPDATSIWVATVTGALWYSGDRGVTWVARPDGETNSVATMDLSSQGVLLVAHTQLPDQNSHLMRTTDQGITWVQAYLMAGVLYEVEFDSPFHAWVAMSGGVVAESLDAGVTYSTVIGGTTGTNNNIYSIDAADGNTLAGVGSNETIVTTEPDQQVPDVGDAGANLTSGGSAFGVCVEGSSGAATNPWAVAGTCLAGTPAHWNPVPPLPSDPGVSVATTASQGSATLNLRFGFRAGPSQRAGTYRAAIAFEVLAPG